jgi:hypothetical protein
VIRPIGRRLLATAGALGVTLALTAIPAPAGGSVAAPGTPGAPDCVGQTTAFVAQAGAPVGIHGIGGLADAAGLTVKQLKAEIQSYCG